MGGKLLKVVKLMPCPMLVKVISHNLFHYFTINSHFRILVPCKTDYNLSGPGSVMKESKV